jgi:hypothetical protein
MAGMAGTPANHGPCHDGEEAHERADAVSFFAGHAQALAVFTRVSAMLREMGPVEVRVSKSQVAFWRARGFAYLWLPGRYLRRELPPDLGHLRLGS